jgi:hypothetical protein
MIASSTNVREIRPIAENLNDTKRLDPYILESEQAEVMDSIGAKVYKAVDAWTTGDMTYVNCAGVTITYTSDEVGILLNGGYYDEDNYYCKGLISSICYLAYSRFVRNQSTNVAAYGMVVKNGQLSEPADIKAVQMQSADAEKLGKSHLESVYEYIKYKEGLVKGSSKPNSSRIKVIGD